MLWQRSKHPKSPGQSTCVPLIMLMFKITCQVITKNKKTQNALHMLHVHVPHMIMSLKLTVIITQCDRHTCIA